MIGLKRENVYITNIVKYRPPNNRDPLPAEIEACLLALDGVRDIFPAAVAAVPIGLLFGAVCVAKGLAPHQVALMSALVFVVINLVVDALYFIIDPRLRRARV